MATDTLDIPAPCPHGALPSWCVACLRTECERLRGEVAALRAKTSPRCTCGVENCWWCKDQWVCYGCGRKVEGLEPPPVTSPRTIQPAEQGTRSVEDVQREYLLENAWHCPFGESWVDPVFTTDPKLYTLADAVKVQRGRETLLRPEVLDKE